MYPEALYFKFKRARITSESNRSTNELRWKHLPSPDLDILHTMSTVRIVAPEAAPAGRVMNRPNFRMIPANARQNGHTEALNSI
jgi:hypothetical protein